MQFKSLLIALVTVSTVTALPQAKPDCAAAKKLADGIDSNISVQKEEQTAVAALEKLLNGTAVDPKAFAAAKTTLLGHINDGIKIRENNQKIAPANNAAIPGLATVATAQATELQQATGLKGTKDDLATTAKLKDEFAGGIKQNQKNKQDALKGC